MRGTSNGVGRPRVDVCRESVHQFNHRQQLTEKVFTTEAGGRATVGHGERKKWRFARSAMFYLLRVLRAPPWCLRVKIVRACRRDQAGVRLNVEDGCRHSAGLCQARSREDLTRRQQGGVRSTRRSPTWTSRAAQCLTFFVCFAPLPVVFVLKFCARAAATKLAYGSMSMTSAATQPVRAGRNPARI